MKLPLQTRHQPSGVNTRFIGAGMSFAEYVRQTEAMLRKVHAGAADQERRVAGNAPFELWPDTEFRQGEGRYRRGVLLTHGLSDSPYHMRHIGECFRRAGFRVMAVLLPGHGTCPGDLLDVRWEDWSDAVAYGVGCLAEEVDEVYLAGFSAGGALSVYQAGRDARVRGLFLFSPALQISGLARWAWLYRLCRWVVPRCAWLHVLPDRDLYKYESLCMNAVEQMWRLTHALPRTALDVPVFVAASADDATVLSGATLSYFARLQHPLKKMIWYAATDPLMSDVEWIKSVQPEERILSSAHTALMMPPTDPHYGERGEYVNCLHYFGQDAERFAACQSSETVWRGEVTPQNIKYGLLRRLTYNPHYHALESSLRQFIAELP